MDSAESTYELVDQYLAGTLSETQRLDFEQRCQGDASFGDQVQRYILAKKSIQDFARHTLRQQVSQAFDAYSPPSPRPLYRRYLWPAVAAVIALLLVIWYVTRPTAPVLNSSELFATYYEAQSVREAREYNPLIDSVWHQALLLFESGQHEASLDLFQILEADSSFSHLDELHLYAGLSHMENTDPQAALSRFEQIKPASASFGPGQWYTGMALLQLENWEDAQAVFESIAQSGRHSPLRRQQAQEIIAVLKQE